ncbi:MAG TPA: L-seryl-tRNA(Sec) selenium transferase, partial [Actinomycetes bacterium]|nr:L-seryl-tRNA(Sec) selenium transferase [Actinomycetes bacterium]
PRRTLPKVDVLLAHPTVAARAATWGRGPVVAAVRRVLDAARAAAGGGEPVPAVDRLAAMVTGDLDGLAGRRMRAVINATGVVLHTNLGRAPLSRAAMTGITEAAGYSTVEYDLAAGRRGRRGAAAEALLRQVTGAPAALVVNNAAGALLLALGGLARGREVVVSRGQLIEIGGEFRLPAIMEAAGVELVEVGTTNRTHLADYTRAIGERTACLLAVHPSNYQVVGFTTGPPLDQVAAVAHRHGLPLLHDLGSGLVGDPFGDEPSVGQSLAAGADLVLFSGDKLLGGPQAGLLVGREDLVHALARNPLARAVRADKLTIAALEATLAAHAAGRRDELPVWRALMLRAEDLRPRAEALASELGEAATVRDGVSVAGGGSLPGEGLPSALVDVDPGPSGDAAILARLRAAEPPVIARAERGRVVVDLRTVPPEQDGAVLRALREALTTSRERAD